MIPPADSLLKYGNPILISKTTDPKSPKPTTEPLGVSPRQQFDSSPIPPPPEPISPSAKAARLQHQEILNAILPPREWTEGGQQWMQQVSSSPCTRKDVLNLEELLDRKLQQRQARKTGICPIRRELYSECFDEIIRQVTVRCAERGLLLLQVRNEIQTTIAAYQMLHEHSVAFGIKKALEAEDSKSDREKRVENLEKEVEDLKKQLEEQKVANTMIEKREAEKGLLEQRKYTAKINCLKTANQQLQAQIDVLCDDGLQN